LVDLKETGGTFRYRWPFFEAFLQCCNPLSQHCFSVLRQSTTFSGDCMALTLTDVKRIAHLARLELADADAEHTLVQLNDFFGLVEQMQAVDTTGIAPLAHPIEQIEDVALRLRDDAVTEIVQRNDFQRPAPAVQDGLYLVPKVIE
jgi:aspartyl-tRNA(Asn)/glutamyl-tRNA(Gln) amidotransferase subunit C